MHVYVYPWHYKIEVEFLYKNFTYHKPTNITISHFFRPYNATQSADYLHPTSQSYLRIIHSVCPLTFRGWRASLCVVFHQLSHPDHYGLTQTTAELNTHGWRITLMAEDWGRRMEVAHFIGMSVVENRRFDDNFRIYFCVSLCYLGCDGFISSSFWHYFHLQSAS